MNDDFEILVVDPNGRWLSMNLTSGEWVKRDDPRLAEWEREHKGEPPAGVMIAHWPEEILPPATF